MGARPGRIVETVAVAIKRPRQRRGAMTPEYLLAQERCPDLLAVEQAATSLNKIA